MTRFCIPIFLRSLYTCAPYDQTAKWFHEIIRFCEDIQSQSLEICVTGKSDPDIKMLKMLLLGMNFHPNTIFCLIVALESVKAREKQIYLPFPS